MGTRGDDLGQTRENKHAVLWRKDKNPDLPKAYFCPCQWLPRRFGLVFVHVGQAASVPMVLIPSLTPECVNDAV